MIPDTGETIGAALLDRARTARDIAGFAAAASSTAWLLRHYRSEAVRAWVPPSLPTAMAGGLHYRYGGEGEKAVVLFHGLVSTGDMFGGQYDALSTEMRLVVPDLLGFGRSLDERRASFTMTDHLDALDQVAHQTDLFDKRWTLGAHSMGSALALQWAARHRERVDRVVCWGAPIYPNAQRLHAEISSSVMARLFVLDTRLARSACALSCRHRAAAGWLAAALTPSLPCTVARGASLHTWNAYDDAMRHLVVGPDWDQLLDTFPTTETTLKLVWGTNDRVGDRGHARAIAAETPGIQLEFIDGADHHLPLTKPQTCIRNLTG